MAEALIGLLLLAVSLAALWQAAVRLVSPVAGSGLDRFAAVVTCVAAAAVLEALALGPVELGTDPIALTAGSVLLWALARILLPAPQLSPTTELARRYWGLDRRGRVAAGAGAGLFAAWCAWVLAEPALDIDGVQYHLPEAVAWIHNGVPGSIEAYLPSFPVGNYPVTNEVLLAWAGGLGGNIAFLLLWAPICAALLALAFFSGVRRFGCTAPVAIAGGAVLIGVPIIGSGATALGTDVPATMWLTVGAALAFRATDRASSPALLAFAIVALGLAVGTKTFTAPLGLLALAVAAWRLRDRRPPTVPIAVSVLVAAGVGGVWYVRNLLTHGSPLWPFVETPGSDPLPPGFGELDSRFIAQPIATLDGKLGDYLDLLGSAPLLIVAALAVPLLWRSHRVAFAAGALALSLLAWMNAPFTGDTGVLVADLLAVSTVRYLMPAVVLATAILALAASRGGAGARLAVPVLGAALIWGLVDLALGRDGLPALWALALGAGAGALLALAPSPLPRPLRAGAIVAVSAIVALALSAYPGRFLELYSVSEQVDDPLTDTRATFGPLVRWFDREPGFSDGDAPVFFEPTIVGPLTGGDLDHDLSLLGGDCAAARERASSGYVVFRLVAPAFGEPPPALACFEGEPERARFPTEAGGSLVVYGGPADR